MRRWKAVGLVLAIAIIAVLVLSYLGLNPYFQFPSVQLPSEYTRVVVPLDNYGTYVWNGTDTNTEYAFGWGTSEDALALEPYSFKSGFDLKSMFTVSSISYPKNSLLASNQHASAFNVTQNAIYEMGLQSSIYGGIEIKVSEIHTDYLVLLVKSL